jgi:Ca2+-binding RTX toxin-like protein
VIVGLGGNDVIAGLQGRDRLCGGDGMDRITGGPGVDLLRAGQSDRFLADMLAGGPGNDRLVGGPSPGPGSWSAAVFTGSRRPLLARADLGWVRGQGSDRLIRCGPA